MIAGYKTHPALEMFPMLSEHQINQIAHSIKNIGQAQPILLSADGKTIIDGRARLRACWIAGVEPVVERLAADDDEADAVWRRNGERSNYSADQRAVIEAQVELITGKVDDAPKSEEEQERLRMARVVVKSYPTIIGSIHERSVTLSRAYAEVEKRRKEYADRIKRAELLPVDLRIQVRDEQITLEAAEAAVVERKKKAAEAAKAAAEAERKEKSRYGTRGKRS